MKNTSQPAEPTSAQLQCLHAKFIVTPSVLRLKETLKAPHCHIIQLRVRCADCYMPFEFIGIPNVFSCEKPSVSAQLLEATIPIQPFNPKQ